MPFTTPPPAPNRNNPSTFSAYMDAFLAWLVVFWQELNSALQLFSTKGYATFQGGSTANALVLSAGYPPGSIEIGTKIRFRATQPNTGSATINLDGTGARQCRTITGASLPAGYIRTDVETEAVFDGTRWILDRRPEIGSNANGQYYKTAEGRLECRAVQESIGLVNNPWTYPHQFAGNADVVLGNAVTAVGDAITITTAGTGSASSISLQFRTQSGGANAVAGSRATVLAIGRWY
ncbi:hypothetical protein MU516_15500 [Paracoccus sp. YLB-12]|uniref:Uncharacterized protein n=1 Tax=Paracoccus maritimus TaxID=2933292 RepID=A0ABT2KCJ3_9RHOB|nr:hypothetical protein [Paracoccus sp. YLB-12]MCT4334270.1 hypothetical protein [Paracoccus sp. YLB-12]